jgi:adenylate cyclase
MNRLFTVSARLVAGTLAGAFVAGISGLGFLDSVEDLSVDTRLRLRKPQAVSDEVRLVGIGDRDVGSVLGRWPFPRAVHGNVLRILKAVGARHVTFDVLFTEPSEAPEQDAMLKTAVEEHGQVTLAYHFEQAELGAPLPDEKPHFLPDGSRFGLQVKDWDFVKGHQPIPPFARLQAGYGAVNVVPDADGVIRRAPLFFAHEGRLYPSLAMQTVISYLGLNEDQIRIAPGHEVTLVDTPRGTLHIPIDKHGQYRVNFLGEIGIFTPAYQYLDLHLAVEVTEEGERAKAAFKDRAVLIGLASSGNTDIASTSIGRMPGVAVQASLVSDILTGNHLRFLPRWQQMLLIMAAGTLLGLGMWPTRVWIGIAVFIAVSVLWCWAAFQAANANLMLPLVPVLAAFGCSTLLLLGLEAAMMKKDRSRVVSVLGRYIARPVLERLVDTDKSAPASTERRELTIFFSDIRGFTAWTERAEPDEVAARLNEYFAAMTPLIECHGGTLDKFIGDCVMVFFGAPAADEKHALHAVQMALDMQQEMTRMNESWRKRGYDPLHIGIGIHTGFVTVGNFGSSDFLDYTVIGRAVNLAARIESQAEGGKVLISARTHSLVHDKVKIKPHPDLVLKGIPEPQVVWEVVRSGK